MNFFFSFIVDWCTSAACAVDLAPIELSKDGSFVDPVTDRIIIIDKKSTFLVTGDVRDNGESYKYLINLGNQIDFSVIGSNKYIGKCK